MDKKKKIALGVGGLILSGLVLSGCNSFCSAEDSAHYRYAYDPLNIRFFPDTVKGEEYVESKFKEDAGLDETASLDFSQLLIYKEVDDKMTLTSITDSDVFSKVSDTNDNLVYLKPSLLYWTDGSLDDDGNIKYYSASLGLSDYTETLMSSASSSGYFSPSYSFYEKFDILTLKDILSHVDSFSWLSGITLDNMRFEDVYGYTYEQYETYRADPTTENLNACLGEDDGTGQPARSEAPYGRNYSLLTTLGYYKHYSLTVDGVDNWTKIKERNNTIANEIGYDNAMSSNYLDYYVSNLDSKAGAIKTCITINDGFYGHTSDDLLNDTVKITGKAQSFWEGWGNAFTQQGFFEGLLVYPISYQVEYFSHLFGMNGWGQIWSVILVTILIRVIFMFISLPSTLSQQKMQYLQPEIAKLQERYPNSNTNNYEKQKLAQATMALYKKHKVKPFMSFLIIFIQFPLFICVWNAMTGSASLSSDAVLGLRLSDTIWNVLSDFSGRPSTAGWRTALVLILLMSISQVVAMLLPQRLNKKRMKKVTKLGVNPSANDTAKSMKIFQWVMVAVIIIMGFQLPSAMGVYWFAGALFGIGQSIVMYFIFNREKEFK
jgi:YidC/Oxa1 family membrane protein insertase